jgi:hypothetical protein
MFETLCLGTGIFLFVPTAVISESEIGKPNNDGKSEAGLKP